MAIGSFFSGEKKKKKKSGGARPITQAPVFTLPQIIKKGKDRY